MSKKTGKPRTITKWRNRIVEQHMVPVAELRANPLNPRRHPKAQQSALQDALQRVGLVQGCVLNLRSPEQGWPAGEAPVLVDGHLRLELALEHGEAELPVTVVDLSPEEERLTLATLDPLGAMAEMDAEALESLIAEVDPGDGALGELLASMGMDPDIDGPDISGGGGEMRTFSFALNLDRAEEIDAAFARARAHYPRGTEDADLFHALVTR